MIAASAARAAAVWTLAVASLAIFLSSVSASLITLALPAILRQFHAAGADLTWISIAYLAPYAAVLPAAGKLADTYGQRPVLLWSFAVYGLASALGATASDAASLIVLRALAGIGGGGLTISLGWVAKAWQGPRQGFAVGLWRALLLAGTVGGPALGGVLTALWGWHSVLWLPAPFAAFGLILAIVYLREPRSAGYAPFDWGGAVAVVVGLGSLLAVLGVSGLVMGPTAVPATPGAGAAFGSHTLLLWALYLVLVAAMLVAWQRLADHPRPIVNIDLLTSRRFAFANLATLLVCVGMFSAMFFVPLYLMYQAHLTTLAAAATTVPMAVVALGAGMAGGAIADRWGVVRPSVAGFALLAIAFVALAYLTPQAPAWYVAVALVVAGVGMGLPLAPTAVVALTAAPADSEGESAGLFNLSHNLGRPVGLVILGAGLAPALASTFSHVFVGSTIAALLGVLASLGMAGVKTASVHEKTPRVA